MQAWQQMQGVLGKYFLAAGFEGKSLEQVNRFWLEFAQGKDVWGVSDSILATINGMVGEYDQAMEYLEEAFATKGQRGKTAGVRFIFLKVGPAFEGLHSDPRFQDLLQRMNLAD